jgi:high-affinity K+ transport system ATPase subunit B
MIAIATDAGAAQALQGRHRRSPSCGAPCATLRKLITRLVKNPVIFVTAPSHAGDVPASRLRHRPAGVVSGQIAAMWFTVLFANFAEAIARPRRQAERCAEPTETGQAIRIRRTRAYKRACLELRPAIPRREAGDMIRRRRGGRRRGSE